MEKRSCCDCIYAIWSMGTWLQCLASCWPPRPSCANHPDTPGRLRPIPTTGPCRNFQPRREAIVRVEPPPPATDAVCHIPLTKGKYAIVDAADFIWLRRFRWHATCTRGRYYAATVINGKSISMHRLIMNPPPGRVVDHIDGNGLNNRRENLRICTPAQNRYNTRPAGKSPYVGVSRAGRRWRAKIRHKGRDIWLGYFDTAIEAARARDAAARKYHGRYAWINLPEEAPDAGKPPGPRDTEQSDPEAQGRDHEQK